MGACEGEGLDSKYIGYSGPCFRFRRQNMRARIIAAITTIPPTVPPTMGPSAERGETADPLPLLLGEGTAEGVDVNVVVVGPPAPEADGATTDGAVSFTAA